MKAKDIYMYVLGAIIVIGFFLVLSVMIFVGGYDKDLSIVLGALIAAFSMVVSYFFGSSKGSSDKNDILKNKNQ